MTTTTQNNVETTLSSLYDYYNSEEYAQNYYFILIEDLQEYGVERLIENSKTHENTLTEQSATMIVNYVIENLEEYVRPYSNYYVGYDSIASACFGEIEDDTPQGYNEDEHDDCGWYIDGENMYLDMSASGIHIPITEHDTLAILDFIREGVIEDMKLSSTNEECKAYDTTNEYTIKHISDTKTFYIRKEGAEESVKVYDEDMLPYVIKNNLILIDNKYID